MKITAIILAAGSSQRMNRPKTNLWINGHSLLEHVLDTVQKARFHEVILVHQAKTRLPEGSFRAVLNDRPEAGVSHSIALGVQASDPQTEGLVFVMADQPFLTAETLRHLKKRFRNNPSRIVIPVFNGQQGSPVLFPVSLKDELSRLTGDTGGRQVISVHQELVVYEPVESEQENLDLDTREDYQRAYRPLTVLVRGAGDLATGVIHVLFEKGCRVIAVETDRPSCIRTEVAFASCIYDGRKAVEGVTAVYLPSLDGLEDCLNQDMVPVLIDPELKTLRDIKPDVVVDAILAKRNLGTTKDLAPLVIALGPGFSAPEDCHAVIETMRGPSLGRIITQGTAIPNTGVPGLIAGEDQRRVIHSPADGILKQIRRIGDLVEEGEVIAQVGDVPVTSRLRGTLRGLIYDGFEVTRGLKIADVDPRLDPALALTISDKARTLGESVARVIQSQAARP